MDFGAALTSSRQHLDEDVKTAIATVSNSGDLPEKLAAIAAAGFDGIEIFEQDFIGHDAGPVDVGRMVRDHGLEITLFQPFRYFEGLPESERCRAFDRAERKFDVMSELGTDLMLICCSVHPKAQGGIDRAADDLAALGERAAKRTLRVGYEALAWGRHVNDHRDAWEIVAVGGLGDINQIHVEFLQDWTVPEGIEATPHEQWRLDPAKSGKTSCVGDIGTHAVHMAQFVSGLNLTDVRAEFHVCGAPKLLEDTVFAWTRHGGVPGTLTATRLAPGNRGGLRLRVFGSEGGLEWDLERSERLKFNRFGKPDQVLSRGHGHGRSPRTEPAGARRALFPRRHYRGLGQPPYRIRHGRCVAPRRGEPADRLAWPAARGGWRERRHLH